MKWDQLPKIMHLPLKLMPEFSNATLPLSDWFLRQVERRRGYVLVENPATGYLLPLSPNELIGFDDQLYGFPCLQLRVGLHFACPNAFFVYGNSSIANVNTAVLS